MNQEKKWQKSRSRSAVKAKGPIASSSCALKFNEYVKFPVNKTKPDGIHSLSKNKMGTFDKE